MTLEEAQAAIAADPAALFFAGSRYDELAASLRTDPAARNMLDAHRASMVGQNCAARLALLHAATAELGSFAIRREQERADAESLRQRREADVARMQQERAARELQNHKQYAAARPAMVSLKSAVDVFEGAFQAARSPAEFESAGQAFDDAVAATRAALAKVAKSLSAPAA